MHTCCKKIVSATKFIDYFVHDMLDYSMLNEDEKKFTKDITIFDVKDAVNEILEIVEDKVTFKNLESNVVYNGF